MATTPRLARWSVRHWTSNSRRAASPASYYGLALQDAWLRHDVKAQAVAACAVPAAVAAVVTATHEMATVTAAARAATLRLFAS